MAGFMPDWSLQRKGATDQRRHMEKIKQALKERLPDLVSDESIVASDGKHVVRVPIRSLEQYKFRFHPWQGDRVGQDQGQGQPGDVLGKLPKRSQQGGQGDQPGETPGIDYIEAEVTLDDIAGLLFDELGLPYLKPKTKATIPEPTFKFKDISPKGLMGNLDKRRSLRQNLLRNARETGQARVGGWRDDDLRFKTWVDEPEPEDNAVFIAMRDISGSMGDFKKMMARTFAFWMLKFLRTQYRAVEVVFLVHHTQAREVSEEEFFQLGESGGTKVSSVYQLCQEVIETRYSPQRWNIYPIHFSDGDNWSDADNRRTVEVLEALLPHVNVFGYGEIREGGYTSTLMSAFSRVKHPRFKMVTITQRQDVYPALKTFFPRKEG
ncbi:sporulation protein YhbH [Sulfobacillus harzensis]|uniref:Sporulation protein YhbH n=1 Tax=Sulfobacillus harzensis TaxID=2729629 RepID=A0A7Y0Q1V8_9FIRM|nr:sporulation protein YhbH [Sulfobacillus harzensis]NMP21857.1 sporulation protein YhbH [Sulfobacillus harzensis]